MPLEVAIIGGGITGAAIAYALSRAGVTDITVIEAGQLAGQSSGRSFGWINASFHIGTPHFEFRHAAMTAWHRYQQDVGSKCISWPGGLVWENRGDEMDAQATALDRLNYAVEEIDTNAFSKLEPNISLPPSRCLYFPEEGVVETDVVTREMFRASGARIISGSEVLGIEAQAGKVTGVRVEQGQIRADRVIVAAGTGSVKLLAPLGVSLPMLQRPGVLMRSRPAARVISHVLASPTQELRQDALGRIIAPTTPAHQSDSGTHIATSPDVLASATLARLQTMLPGAALDWEEVMLAMRPVPGDGLPVMGPCGPDGLYLAVMHSGATLAALAGELAAQEILRDHSSAMLSPFRPGRFTQ